MKQKIVFQKNIHFEVDREPLHPVFESCLDGVSSLKKMEENLFTKVKALDEMFPFCEDFEFIKQIEWTADKSTYTSWYELIGTVDIQSGIKMDIWEGEGDGCKKLEELTIPELQQCVEKMSEWVTKGDSRLGKKLEENLKSDLTKKRDYFNYTYYMLLPEKEREEIFKDKEISLFEWQK